MWLKKSAVVFVAEVEVKVEVEVKGVWGRLR
jgi:hypothetical protein